MTAEYKAHGDVAVITLNNPPVNGLGLATRTAFAAALSKAQLDSKIKAIVVAGAGKALHTDRRAGHRAHGDGND